MGEEEPMYEGFVKATKLAEVAKFQDSLNVMNEVFEFHPEGGIAYKYYYRSLVEDNLEGRIRDLERAKESFLFLFKTVNRNMEKPGMTDVHNLMLDHFRGLQGARRSTLEEYDRLTEAGLVDFSIMSSGIPEEL